MDRNAPLSTSTLLIIDDSVSDRTAFRRYLTKDAFSNYKILEAESAEDGLTLLEREPVDLILLDYDLPGLDGLVFLQRLNECTGINIPVLMLTGQGDERIAAQSIKAGAKDYIIKTPDMADALQRAVRTTLKESALQAQVATYQAQQTLVQDIALRIRQSLNLDEILRQTAFETRNFLTCDRVVLYRFLPDRAGIIEVESVGPKWTAIQGQVIEDSCFKNGWIEDYLTGNATAVNNIHNSQLTPCHIQLLARFQVQANLVVPIIVAMPSQENTAFGIGEKTLWGLLIAHQCDAPRQWTEVEIQLLKQLSDQLALALQQSMLYHQLQVANQQLEANVEARTAELQQVNASLLHVNQALITSNQDLEQFAYIASHDLREPLRKIKSFAELLAKRYQGELDETGDRYINYITNGAVRMQSLINDLLAYSRLGRHQLVRVRTDLNTILAQALNTLSATIAEKQATIHAKPLPTLAVEAIQLEQLFRNLIENALKYSGDNPPDITITAERNADQATWTFSFKDNGIGIEPEFYERIFSIFQRLHSKSEYSGTGIGLAICQKIVERHGGKIGVDSAVNQGSTFWFTLPEEPPENQSGNESEREPDNELDSELENQQKT